MNKKRVAIIFGGVSPEHEVSLMSATGVLDSIDRESFQVVEIGIAPDGLFYSGDGVLDAFKKKQYVAKHKKNILDVLKDVDVVFPVMHGVGGEDGSIQGFLKTIHIPFVGADVLASAVCLDKALCKTILHSVMIPQTPYVVLDYTLMPEKSIAEGLRNCRNLKLPLFVKPSRLGSSVGISKVIDWNDLDTALATARTFDTRIVVEQGVAQPREIEVSVLGNDAASLQVSLPGEIKPAADFYTYDDKYIDGQAQAQIPADVSPEVLKRIQDLARKVYSVTDCKGFARVDFLLSGEQLFVNEINTIPGFTPISMYAKMWEASGLSYKELITKLIALALEPSNV